MTQDQLLAFAEFGPLVPLHSVDDQGVCGCGNPHEDRPNSRGKHPRMANWQGKSIKAWHQLLDGDLSTLKRWNRSFPGTNWGLMTGHRVLVVDMDVKDKDGEVGVEELEFEAGRKLPDSLRVRTGSGGARLLGAP